MAGISLGPIGKSPTSPTGKGATCPLPRTTPGPLYFDDFLPNQHGEVAELRDTRKTPSKLGPKRGATENPITMLDHAPGAGKTVTAIADVRDGWPVVRCSSTHTRSWWSRRESNSWNALARGQHGRFDAERTKPTATISRHCPEPGRNLDGFDPKDFAYLVIDEAHHATADTYQMLVLTSGRGSCSA